MTEEAARHLSKQDKILGRWIEKVGPPKIDINHGRDPYGALLEAIVYQQLTGKAAGTILGRVLKLFPKRKFPTPDDILGVSIEALRGAGLSGAKTAAIRDLAAKAKEGKVPSTRQIKKMTDEEIVEHLTEIRGVGRWTVEMLLIFKLGRHDVLPATDYGVRKGFMMAYRRKELPEPKEILEFGERWRPHRTTAAWYLWRVLDLPQGKTNRPAVR